MGMAEFAELVAQRKMNRSSVVTLSIAEAENLLSDMMFAFGKLATSSGSSLMDDMKKALGAG